MQLPRYSQINISSLFLSPCILPSSPTMFQTPHAHISSFFGAFAEIKAFLYSPSTFFSSKTEYLNFSVTSSRFSLHFFANIFERCALHSSSSPAKNSLIFSSSNSSITSCTNFRLCNSSLATLFRRNRSSW